MIDLDYNELNAAATYLLGKVVDFVPQRFNAEETIKFRALVFNKLIHFVRADVPCEIQTSIQLFEQCLKTSELGSFPSVAQFNSIEDDIPALFKQMDFSLFGSAQITRSSQKQKIGWVQKEMLRCRQAVIDNLPYKNQKYAADILSIEADKNNKRIFQEYFEKIKKSNTLYTATPFQLAQYVTPVIEQTQALQMQLATNWDLSSAINKRRKSTQIDEDTPYTGSFFN